MEVNDLDNLVGTVREVCINRDLDVSVENITHIVRELQPLMSPSQRLDVVKNLHSRFNGLGALDELLLIKGITDIVVNSHDEIWIDKGDGMQRVPTTFGSEQELRNFAVRLASLANRRLDEASPWVDARMPSGIRLHAIIPPLSVRGTVISLRIPARATFDLADLISAGSVSPAGAQLLREVIAANLSIIICGGTGSGKTTILNCLLALIPQDKRIVIVEDSQELNVSHPHVVSLQSRTANVEGVGAIPMRTLVRQALRMRPDRIVVGEVRGQEIVDLLSALNTGHEGGSTTIHANSASSVPARVEALGLMSGMPLSAIRKQLLCGVQVVIDLAKDARGRRIVSGLHVLQESESGEISVVQAVDLNTDQEFEPGYKKLNDLLQVRYK